MTGPKVHHLPRLGLAEAMRVYGLTARALHYYEELGLVEACRDRSNTRYYDPDGRRRLDWIAPLRRADVPMAEIRDVLRAENESGRGGEYALRALVRRQEALEAQVLQVKDARLALEAAPVAGARRVPLRSRA